jgi:hypothetical protein
MAVLAYLLSCSVCFVIRISNNLVESIVNSQDYKKELSKVKREEKKEEKKN